MDFIYIYVHIKNIAHIHIYIYTFVHMYICTSIHVYICTYMHKDIFTYRHFLTCFFDLFIYSLIFSWYTDHWDIMMTGIFGCNWNNPIQLGGYLGYNGNQWDIWGQKLTVHYQSGILGWWYVIKYTSLALGFWSKETWRGLRDMVGI